MGRIFAVISVVVFAVALGCGEAPESIGNQGDGNGGGGGGSGSVSPVQVDEECFDFEGDERADYDRGYWDRWILVEKSDIGNPDCEVDGLGYAGPECEGAESGTGLYVECYNHQTVPEQFVRDEPCMWKVVAQLDDDACRYFTVCLTEEDYPLVPSYDFHFPDGWGEAVDKYCVD